MRKLICVLGAVICFMSCAVSALADVIWVPEDSFYVEHASECTYEGRTYTANGPDGVVILYASPQSSQKIDTWENGHTAYISFIYKDKRGTLWGICEEDHKSGWVPMEYMDEIYDNVSFAREYESEIQEQDGALDGQYMGKDIYLWEYPASPDPSVMTVSDNVPEYYRVYEDSAGHSWGYVGYYYGYRDKWICLDAPDAGMDVLYPDTAPGIGETRPVEKDFTGERIVPEEGQGNAVALAAGMVLLVVAITAGLLFALKQKGRQKSQR